MAGLAEFDLACRARLVDPAGQVRVHGRRSPDRDAFLRREAPQELQRWDDAPAHRRRHKRCCRSSASIRLDPQALPASTRSSVATMENITSSTRTGFFIRFAIAQDELYQPNPSW